MSPVRSFGRTLKRLRTERGLSMYALAKRAGISDVYVGKLETNKSDPTLGMLRRLAKALDVPVTRLLE
jgi:transcriptional regulator with XRE-family HTH domain